MEERKALIAKRLREIRGHMTQSEFADWIGVEATTVSMYERAERIPSDAVKIRIAELCGKTVQEIFFD